MRKIFTETLVELARKDPRMYLILLDTGGDVFSGFSREHPDRCLNFGVAEQAAIGVASGMALEGFRPWVYSIAPFVLDRPYEFIKNDVVGQNAPVKLVGYWDYPDAGSTHLSRDPRSLCQVLGLRYHQPESTEEVARHLKEEQAKNSPAFFYLRRASR